MRPPDHAVHDYQTSNSTANAFLGGRRMPSWLTSGQLQTNATPLVPSRKRPPPKELDRPRRSSKPALERPSSSASPNLPYVPASAPQAQPSSVAVQNVSTSNPASPALPNIVARRTSQPSNSNENNILPSPAPSEDMSAGRGRAATIVSLGDEDEEDDGGHNGDSRGMEGAIPAQKRSSSLVMPESSPTNGVQAATPATVEQASGAAAISRPQGPSNAAASGHPNFRHLGSEVTVQAPRSADEHSPPQDPGRWRTLPPPGTSCFAPGFCLQQLQHLRNISHHRGLSSVESVRVELVREAASIGDRDYLRFHQLMCLRALSAQRLPLELLPLPGTIVCLELLNHLVQSRECSTAWLQWFADFPVSQQCLKERWPEEYDRQILHFKQFITLAKDGWDKLQKACFEKRLPPTAVEIRKELGMSSPIFQSIFNRAIFRRICSFPEPNTQRQIRYFSDAEAEFKEHQHRLQHLRTTVPTTQQLSEDEMGEEQRYRERIIMLQRGFLAQGAQPDVSTAQAQRMSRHIQISQGQQPNSPVYHQTHSLSPAQNSPPVMPTHQNQAPAPVQQRTMPTQQTGRPQVQISVPRRASESSQMAQFGTMTPTSTVQSPNFASVQNMNNHAVYYQNQQQVRQPVQTGSPMMGPPNGYVLTSTNQSPIPQYWAQGQSQSPMSPPFPSPGVQGRPVPQGVPNGARHQAMYPYRQSGPAISQGNQYQAIPQQILRSNSAPSVAPIQGPRQPAPQLNPGQITGHARSPVYVQQPPAQRFVPPAGHMWPLQAIDPSQAALHQAHLRSPVLKSIPTSEIGRKLYQSVVNFAISPIRLADKQAHQHFSFSISPEDKSRLPSETPAEPGKSCTRLVAEDTKIYRLRCARSSSTEEHEWVLQDTFWPAGMFLNLNGGPLEMRKKLQHGKDLPIDITSLLRAGENHLEINLLRRPNEEKISNFVMAVEIVGIQHYDRIKDECSNRVVPAEDVLSSIKSSMNGPENDDDVAVLDDKSEDPTIKLFDPFTNCRPCDIPVRGKYCAHRDCFDLEIFLQTRDRRHRDGPSLIDVWRCPICRADVRPKSLIVDGFLIEVHKQLSVSGQLDTRAIIVDRYGKWKPKPEKKQDDSRASDSATPEGNNSGPVQSAPSSHLPSSSPEVIELD